MLAIIITINNGDLDHRQPSSLDHGTSEMWTHKRSVRLPKEYGIARAWRGTCRAAGPLTPAHLATGRDVQWIQGYGCLELLSTFSAAWKGHHLSPTHQSMSPPPASTTSRMVSILTSFPLSSPYCGQRFPLSLPTLPSTAEPSAPPHFLP